jgi:hypothetical protein
VVADKEIIMWEPRILAAEAQSATQFTIALGVLDYDDPFTALVTYDGRFSPPWSRVDVRREIVDLTYAAPPEESEPVPVALSNEGDVNVLTENLTRSKIPGAGISSPDATGQGATWAIVAQGGILHVAGDGGQLYRQSMAFNPADSTWEDISPAVDNLAGYEPAAFSHLARRGTDQLILASHLSPILTQPGNPEYELTDDMSVDEMLQMMSREQQETSPGPALTRLYSHADGRLSQINAPEDIQINDLFVEAGGRVWVVGVSGLILRGTPQDGLTRIGFHGDDLTLLSVTQFRGETIMASHYMLHRFDGHRLTTLRPVVDPAVNRGIPVPLRVQGFDDALIYFDAKHGVSHWDGNTWTKLEIPAALLSRVFDPAQFAIGALEADQACRRETDQLKGAYR